MTIELRLDYRATWCGHPRLMAGDVMLGFVVGSTLATLERDWLWGGIDAFKAAVVANPAAALACADGAMSEARTEIASALCDAREGKPADVRKHLAAVDNAIAVAKAWRDLAGYDPA